MNSEYQALMRLSVSLDYKILEAIWLHHLSAIEKSRDSAAARGQESAWRYFAGQEKGAKRIMMALATALIDMESKSENENEESKYDALLKEIKGEKP